MKLKLKFEYFLQKRNNFLVTSADIMTNALNKYQGISFHFFETIIVNY